LEQVLEPISQNKEGKYQKYDWDIDVLTVWYHVPVGGIVIVEGVYSTRKELAHKCDLTICVDCPRETRLQSGIEIDGEEARHIRENNWMVSEDLYAEHYKPIQRADTVFKGEKG
jgi:uridine kinase